MSLSGRFVLGFTVATARRSLLQLMSSYVVTFLNMPENLTLSTFFSLICTMRDASTVTPSFLTFK